MRTEDLRAAAPDVRLQGVTHRYGGTTALDDVSVHLEGGRIHGLLGRNGSGKTTLLSIAAAFLRPSVGVASVDGRPIYEDPAVTSQVCLIRGSGDSVEQDWPEDRVEDALRVAATLRETWDADYAERLIDTFGIDRRARLNQLSRGQRSAVGVVLGLASRSPVTMFDESYLGMDAPSRYAFYDELLADVAAHPRTVIVSTHLIEELSRLLEHVTIIDRGRVLVHDEAEALRGRGVVVTGHAAAVESVVGDLTPLHDRRLGSLRAVSLLGPLDDARIDDARRHGCELDPLPLQDLFVHLTTSQTTEVPA